MNHDANLTNDAPAASHPKLKRLFRLQWEPAQNASVLLYPEGMVKLNQSAAEILRRCDGTHSFDAIVADLERTFDTNGLAPEVRAFVGHAYGRGWLE